MKLTKALLVSSFVRGGLFALKGARAQTRDVDSCPGYNAVNIANTNNGFKADLELAGTACNVYGSDYEKLSLEVTYENENRIHVKIADPEGTRYEVPESVFPRPSLPSSSKHRGHQQPNPNINFKYTASPFSFQIVRKGSNEVLFDTTGNPLVFEPQYLRLKTALPSGANIYGLGEHTDPFRLPPNNSTQTFWNRDAYSVPPGTNLYGDHPIYFEHRTTGTHGVFLLNSNGMDVKLRSETNGNSLEYNAIGGILDFYFLAGPGPLDVAQQYASLVGTPAEIPYWGLGFHQCRYGYTDYLDVADVVANYSAAGIPLETMWTDIDYMYDRLIMTTDPNYFPLPKMRELVSDLHARNQHYILMVDPAVGVRPGVSGAYDRGSAAGVWLKNPNGTDHLGIVWPGVVVWPDWFNNNTLDWWKSEFANFFNPDTGIDIDGAWIDMNEPASFCTWPCSDPYAEAIVQGLPPNRTTAPPPADAPLPIDPSAQRRSELYRRTSLYTDVIFPPYQINNAAGNLSDKTAFTDVVHANGLIMYDTHNLFGTMMSAATHEAMEARRPGLRTFVITRSTFPGAGTKVGKWLGDNISDWDHYRNSISGMLGFATIYQVPEVGADVCGFGGNTTEILCSRWATLGAFSPFFRNHNQQGMIDQEFYRWPTTTQAAKNGIDMRYRLLDYFYTALHQAHLDGTPVLQPLWFQYPQDANTFPIDLQFFFGDSVLVSPVTDENSTSVSLYLPDDVFYDFLTHEEINGSGANVQLSNVDYASIPVYIKGGSVLPLRVESTYTTTDLRKKDFELVVAPNRQGEAEGTLYYDDGVSIQQSATLDACFHYSHNQLQVETGGRFDVGSLQYASVTILGVSSQPSKVTLDGRKVDSSSVAYNATSKSVSVKVSKPLGCPFTLHWS